MHTAPGHGREDYEVGLQYGLEAYSPVDDAGRFTDEVEFFDGQFVFDANAGITAKLKEAGALLACRDDRAFLSPLLALQAAGHLPGHPAVVHLHGQDRPAPKIPGSHRPGDLDSRAGVGSASTA